MHRYIITKYRFDLGQNPPIILGVMALFSTSKNGFGFGLISFEKISVLDSNLIH